MHYQDKLASLPENVKKLFNEYTRYEMNRYFEGTPTEDTLTNLEFMCDVCAHFISDELLELVQKAFVFEKSNVSFYAAQTLLKSDKELPQTVVTALANDLSYACLLYDSLKEHGKQALFPAELASPE